MKLLEPQEVKEYCEFMDKIAILVYSELTDKINDLRELDPEFDVPSVSTEMGWSVGQTVYDEVIKLTKDMSQEQILRWFTETSMALLVNTMMQSPNFFMRIKLLKKFS